jgi:hypothetical protein
LIDATKAARGEYADMSRKDLSVGVTAALVALSQGTCYYPNCPRRTVVISEGVPSLDLERAHIYPATWGGPREDRSYPMEKRDHFENIILLCKPHHTRVDRKVDDYPAHVLLGWKHEREASGMMTLQSLGSLTEERLQELLTIAASEQLAAVKEAINRLEKYDLKSASLLKGLIGTLEEYQVAGYYLNADLVSMLDSAAHAMKGFLYEDNVNSLAFAAKTLRDLDLGERLVQLENLVNRIAQRLPEY